MRTISLRPPGVEGHPQLMRDPSWEQNDSEVSGSPLYEARGVPAENDTSADLTYDYQTQRDLYPSQHGPDGGGMSAVGHWEQITD